VICAIYETSDGRVELRAGYSADHVLRSECLANAAAARTRAAQWLTAFRAAGSLHG
jgi:hypothetical protein